ncbi:MAG: hypothetical protein EXS13_07320 [Planctomycetes bacterium]|nr:hypothetical protein [Planctomycetota bacterium]
MAARPAAAPAARPAAAPARPAAAPARAAPRPVEKKTARAHHAIHDSSQISFDKATKIGFGICGGLLVIVLIVVLSVKGTKDEIRDTEEKRVVALTELVTKVELVDFGSDSSLKETFAYIEANKEIWKGSERDSAVSAVYRRVQAAIDNAKLRTEILARVDIVKQKMAAADALSPEQMRDLKRELEELDGLGTIVGDKIAKEISELRKTSEHIFAQQFFAYADKLASGGGEQRVALRAATFAEDQLRETWDNFRRAKNAEETAFYEPIYKSVLALTDKIAYDLFNAGPERDQLDGEESMGFKDLLSEDAKKKWNPTNTKGFSWRIEGGVMQIVGPDADTNQKAILAIGDIEQWRHYMLQMEFTLEAGNFDIFFRLGRKPNNTNPNFVINPSNTDPARFQFEAGKKYTLRFGVMGSRFQVKLWGDEEAVIHIEDCRWTDTRAGAIGLQIPPGCRMRVTEFKLREFN